MYWLGRSLLIARSKLGEIAGATLLADKPSEDEVFIAFLAVEIAFQRKGVSKELGQAAIDFAKERGRSALTWACADSHGVMLDISDSIAERTSTANGNVRYRMSLGNDLRDPSQIVR